jgi:transcriptional regulator with XRE-family HTH domain
MSRFSGDRLREFRQARQFRREHLADRIEKSVETLRLYETNRVDPPASVVARIADSLRILAGDLFEEVAA